MLNIKNIEKLEGMKFLSGGYERSVKEVTEVKDSFIGTPYYSIVIGGVLTAPPQQTKWFGKTELRLSRDGDMDGMYRLFVMGIQLATEIRITLRDLKNTGPLLYKVSECLDGSKRFWDKNS